MKVIKHGNTYQEIECNDCHALLSYCISDIRTDTFCGEYFGEIHSSCKKYIVCPECKKHIMLSFVIDGEETIT